MATNDELKELMESVLTWAKQVLQEHGRLIPTAFVVARNGGTTLIGMPFRSKEEKLAMFEACRKDIKKIKPTMVAFVSEAWLAIAPPDAIIRGSVSGMKGRIEVIQIDAACHGYKAMMSVEIKRNFNDEPYFDDSKPTFQDTKGDVKKMESRLLDGLFAPPTALN